MIFTGVLIALNALAWGGFGLGFAASGTATDPAHADGYVYLPLMVAFATVAVPTIAIITGRLRSGHPRAWLRTT